MEIGPDTEGAIRDLVYAFFAEECGVERATLTDGTNIITELEGDSLMFLMLLERVRKQYGIGVPLEALAKRLMKKPASTIGQVVDLSILIVRHDGDFGSL